QPAPEPAAPEPTRPAVARRLNVGDTVVGEIRLTLRTRLAESDEHAFSAFAEAVASAFHDAATNRTLRAMTARSAYGALHPRPPLRPRGNAARRELAPDAPVALVLVAVGGLRRVNDTLGYAAGDDLLAVLARRLRERQLDGEILGRSGGGEFSVLMFGAPAAA